MWLRCGYGGPHPSPEYNGQRSDHPVSRRLRLEPRSVRTDMFIVLPAIKGISSARSGMGTVVRMPLLAELMVPSGAGAPSWGAFASPSEVGTRSTGSHMSTQLGTRWNASLPLTRECALLAASDLILVTGQAPFPPCSSHPQGINKQGDSRGKAGGKLSPCYPLAVGMPVPGLRVADQSRRGCLRIGTSAPPGRRRLVRRYCIPESGSKLHALHTLRASRIFRVSCDSVFVAALS